MVGGRIPSLGGMESLNYKTKPHESNIKFSFFKVETGEFDHKFSKFNIEVGNFEHKFGEFLPRVDTYKIVCGTFVPEVDIFLLGVIKSLLGVGELAPEVTGFHGRKGNIFVAIIV